MPKYKAKRTGLAAWLLLATVIAGLLYAAASAPFVAAAALVLSCSGLFLSHRAAKREEKHLRRLAAEREAESICDFARAFDARAVDTWIIRAVYEQLQWQLQHVHSAFPVRASDRLKEDLYLDDDDLDIDVAVQVEQRTGRNLDTASANPLFGKVKTVQDLVLFYQAQPRRSAP